MTIWYLARDDILLEVEFLLISKSLAASSSSCSDISSRVEVSIGLGVSETLVY